ncbi:MAG: folate-binding protein YgfZ [Microcoleus sp. PH2017_22_RUC_O_B]|uniref:CAF17-like 4Fe-4S cluster assembly/insertion protein YgfZ n=1 Tax=unclassified Microcoleus TaxID=2642155 RepID=UPI001DF54366|nr:MULTISPECIES: folate-binding protein [unclassified Microcoleus]MCC3531049.1 folate-binding protein YgfZ [Microcoleus sp. PH2017_21_RUC_O_A]MCC3543397.1 folate-binding protein YgfZ [Microcoleus sp. PH2017_22_RUC_O_B]
MLIQELHDIQAAAGATFAELATTETVPISFGNDGAAIAATKQGAALYDRTHWGRIQISGSDRLRFLHNQSTNNFNILKPGQGCDTVFVTSTARTIDLATAYATEDAVILLVSANRRRQLLELLDRYIFPMDRVELTDLTDTTVAFSLLGPESTQLLEKLGVTELENQPYATHKLIKTPPLSGDEEEVRLAVGSGLATPGYTLIAAASDAARLWNELVKAGAVPMGDRVWEQLRIQQGRPATDFELTDDYNPLEARLLHTITYDKGCYIGQETIARLNTYQGVKQQLWGLQLSGAVEPGTVITIKEEKVGKITSFTETESGFFGLAYIRTKAGGEKLKVQVGEVSGEVVNVPFLSS